jgi:ribosomal protein L7Ae-like RNA K-turn-binding protein
LPIRFPQTIESPVKGQSSAKTCSQTEGSKDQTANADAFGDRQAPEDQTALISLLVDKLATFRTKSQDRAVNSGATSPLLDADHGRRGDPIPSSPKEVGCDLFSPKDSISREHSTECLEATLQRLSLQTENNQAKKAIAAQPSLWEVAEAHFASSTTSGGSTPKDSSRSLSQREQQQNPTLYPTQQSIWHQPAGNPASFPGFDVPTPTMHSTTDALSAYAAALSAAQQPQHAETTYAPQTPNINAHPGSSAAAYHALLAQQLAATTQQLSPLHAYPQLQAMALAHLGMLQQQQQQHPVDECLVGLEGKYQPYCRQIITEELNTSAHSLLSKIKALQLADPPTLSRMVGKRYFCSLKEVAKVVGGAKMILIAPDVRPSVTAHIKPVRLLQMIMAAAESAGVPYVFCLSRRGIGQVFGREKSMSIVAVMNLEGVEQEYVRLLEASAQGRQLYYAAHRAGSPAPVPDRGYNRGYGTRPEMYNGGAHLMQYLSNLNHQHMQSPRRF